MVGSEVHFSLHDAVGNWFLSLNERRLEEAQGLTGVLYKEVWTCSHFLPRPELYYGMRGLTRVMGCRELDAQVRSIGSKLHIFGHSHINLDKRIEGVRYLQHARGHRGDGGARDVACLWEKGAYVKRTPWAFN